jgi:hypothetical protein
MARVYTNLDELLPFVGRIIHQELEEKINFILKVEYEIENRLLDERAQKYLYDEINSRYSSNLAYPIYFSTNPHNVKRYINDYLNSATSDVYFEILTSSGETFIKFNPYSDYCVVYSQK